jgi:hypothetical protein
MQVYVSQAPPPKSLKKLPQKEDVKINMESKDSKKREKRKTPRYPSRIHLSLTVNLTS